jgi:hypothetical protein
MGNRDFEGQPEGEVDPAVLEEHRKVESVRRVLIETINVIFKEYDVSGLKHVRHCIQDAKTYDEIFICAQMIVTIGRFHGGSL